MSLGSEENAAPTSGTSLCVLRMGAQRFGIETRRIREVLGPTRVQRVPLAAAYIAGMVSYRGEVLTTVSLRVLLGGDEVLNGSIVVLDSVGDTQLSEQFGLLVDGVDGVVDVGRELLRDNLLAVSEAYSGLCCGAFRTSVGLIVELDGGRLNPVWLAGQTREGIREGSRP